MSHLTETLKKNYNEALLDTQGTFSNLNAEQEACLSHLWKLLLPILEQNDRIDFVYSESTGYGKSDQPIVKKNKDILFSQKVGEVCEKNALPPPSIKKSQTSFTSAFFTSFATLHPDSVLLKFLRARKWNVDKALEMLQEAVVWRAQNNVAELMWYGETNLNYRYIQKKASFIAGSDRLGQSVLYIEVNEVIPAQLSLKDLLKHTVHLMEVSMRNITLEHEKITIFIDVKNMSFKNFDWHFFKLFLKFLTDYYPESLALVLIYSSSWVFRSLWATIRMLLDPVVASKVHFAESFEDVLSFIDKDQLIQRYGGDLQTEYYYVLPYPGENDKMYNTADAQKSIDNFQSAYTAFLDATSAWVAADSNTTPTAKKHRDTCIQNLLNSAQHYENHHVAKNIYNRIQK
ncbi:hypothetical protein BB561_003332 [Smittium simulii]|uniref:CRAL-TRIO domain-containing protein n=1 Tax=Smittium simulii TaxID=133385 RepID=A0A2T9YLZ5_9FUNG|nr:hypothetical protein BB561_003332 [Smittium simulii]